MSYKVCGQLDLSIDDIKKTIKGSQLLSAAFSADRAIKGLSPVTVSEDYFVRYAINKTIEDLETEIKNNETWA